MSLYYQGVYSFGASLATSVSCATKLARYDGVEQLSLMAGTALSPFLFRLGGYLGSFVVGIVGNALAVVYLVWFTTGT